MINPNKEHEPLKIGDKITRLNKEAIVTGFTELGNPIISINLNQPNSIEGNPTNRPSILNDQPNSIEGTITTYKKYHQEYYRYSYYEENKKKHIHLGNINCQYTYQFVKQLKRQKLKVKQILQLIKEFKNG